MPDDCVSLVFLPDEQVLQSKVTSLEGIELSTVSEITSGSLCIDNKISTVSPHN